MCEYESGRGARAAAAARSTVIRSRLPRKRIRCHTPARGEGGDTRQAAAAASAAAPKATQHLSKAAGRGAAAAARSRNGMGIGNKIVKQARKQTTAEPSASATRGKRSRPRQLGKKVKSHTRDTGKEAWGSRRIAAPALPLWNPKRRARGERRTPPRQPGRPLGESSAAGCCSAQRLIASPLW